MLQIIGILLVVAAAVLALKLALFFALLLGVIFRTKQTLGLILVLGALALLRNYPAICYTVIGIAVLIAFVKSKDDDAGASASGD